MQVLQHGKVVGTSQKWPAKAGCRSPKGPAVAGTTVVQTYMAIYSNYPQEQFIVVVWLTSSTTLSVRTQKR